MKTSSIYMLQELSPQEHVQFHCAEQHCLDTLVTFFLRRRKQSNLWGPNHLTFFRKQLLMFQTLSQNIFFFLRYILVLSEPSVWHENEVLVSFPFAKDQSYFQYLD